ncbi:MAG: hypothetical protein IPJ13_08265 [Saprospiraceae bacterium]|nr:hypothetical protein [Saprospiraceae bacterium]
MTGAAEPSISRMLFHLLHRNLLTTSIGIENKRFNATIIGRYTGQTRTKPGQGAIIVPTENVKYNDVNDIAGFDYRCFSKL